MEPSRCHLELEYAYGMAASGQYLVRLHETGAIEQAAGTESRLIMSRSTSLLRSSHVYRPQGRQAGLNVVAALQALTRA